MGLLAFNQIWLGKKKLTAPPDLIGLWNGVKKNWLT
jgi:hypothetical protein